MAWYISLLDQKGWILFCSNNCASFHKPFRNPSSHVFFTEKVQSKGRNRRREEWWNSLFPRGRFLPTKESGHITTSIKWESHDSDKSTNETTRKIAWITREDSRVTVSNFHPEPFIFAIKTSKWEAWVDHLPDTYSGERALPRHHLALWQTMGKHVLTISVASHTYSCIEVAAASQERNASWQEEEPRGRREESKPLSTNFTTIINSMLSLINLPQLPHYRSASEWCPLFDQHVHIIQSKILQELHLLLHSELVQLNTWTC